MVRVTVNVPEAAAGRPRDQAAHARRRRDRPAHRRLPLQRPPAADPLPGVRRRARQVPDQSRATSAPASRRDEQFATICGVARDRNKPVRIGVNGGSLNQELVVAKMQENTDRDLGHTSEDIINECMVLSARAVHRARARVRPPQGSDHHLVQDVAAARPDRRLSRSRRARPISRCTSGSPKRAWGPKGWSGRRPRWASC